MARITHPRPTLGRARGLAGIEFIDGIADVDLADNMVLRQALVQHGYVIDDAPELEEKTVEDLRAELESYGYEVKKSWRKAELVERIAQHRDLTSETGHAVDGEEFASVELADGTVVGDGTSIVTLGGDGTATVGN